MQPYVLVLQTHTAPSRAKDAYDNRRATNITQQKNQRFYTHSSHTKSNSFTESVQCNRMHKRGKTREFKMPHFFAFCQTLCVLCCFAFFFLFIVQHCGHDHSLTKFYFSAIWFWTNKNCCAFFFVFFWSHPNIKLPLAHGIHALNASGLIDEKATTNQNITRLELSRFLNFLMLLALFNHFWWTKMALLPCLA